MRVPKRPEALSLLDLRQKSQLVQIDEDQEIEVFGLSAEAIADLMNRFPTLQRFLLNVGLQREDILKEVPEAIAAIIAAGCGQSGVQAHEEAARDLHLEAQAAIIEAVIKCTFTRGFGPFVGRLQAMGLQTTSAPLTKAPASRSPITSPNLPKSIPDTTPGNSHLDSSSPGIISQNEENSSEIAPILQ